MWKKVTKKKIFIGICVIIIAAGGGLALRERSSGYGAEVSEIDTEAKTDYDEAGESPGDSGSALAEKGESASSDASSGTGGGLSDLSAAGQKMVVTWDFNIESADYEGSIARIAGAVQSLKGYIEYENESNEDGGARSASYVIRIPDEGEAGWMDKMESFGTVVSKSKSTENVTLQYIDTESRLSALKTERKALEKLLGPAKKVEDIIQIQSQLQDVNYQIESYESQLRSMQNDIDYMTVNLYITEVNREASRSPGIMDEVKLRFADTADRIRGFARGVFVGILGYSLYIVLLALTGAAAWGMYKKRKRKNGKHKKESDD